MKQVSLETRLIIFWLPVLNPVEWVIWRRVNRVEFCTTFASDNTMISSSWDDNGVAFISSQAFIRVFDEDLDRTSFDAKELINVLMYLAINFFIGIKTHQNQLHVDTRVEHSSESRIVNRQTIYLTLKCDRPAICMSKQMTIRDDLRVVSCLIHLKRVKNFIDWTDFMTSTCLFE